MKITKELLGARIKELRKNKGLSQEQLSEKIEIDSKHLSRIEVGKSYPSINTLNKIAVELKIELKDLFEFMHHTNEEELKKSLIQIINEVTEDKLKLISKIITSLVH